MRNLAPLLALLVVLGEVRSAVVPERREADEATETIFDAMQTLMTPGIGKFQNPEFERELYQCLGRTNPLLKRALERAWNGMVHYSDPEDHWGSCYARPPCPQYLENNELVQEYGNLTIYEPCNYVSSLAYSHLALAICKHPEGFAMPEATVRALVASNVYLAVGSAMNHGSHTKLGQYLDDRLIDVVSFIIYQDIASNLPGSSENPVLNDMSHVKRPQSGVEITDVLTDIFLNKDSTEWAAAMESLDMPPYRVSFGGIVSAALLITAEDTAATVTLLAFLSDLFGSSQDVSEFLRDVHLPQMVSSTSELVLSEAEKARLRSNLASALVKVLYAFVWQENVLSGVYVTMSPTLNRLGNVLIPTINAFSNALNDFPKYYDDLQQTGWNLFPNATECNNLYPHSKFHQQSASGLFDLILVADQLRKALEDTIEQ